MSKDIAFSSIRTLRGMLSDGKLSSRELVEIFAARIDKYNSVSKAFITPTIKDALSSSISELSRQEDGHVLRGIPYASKDLFDVKGVLTTAASRVLHDRAAEVDSHCIAQLRAVGAVSLGKLNAHEFAYGATGENENFGTCVNAYDQTRLAGGSSSGSAAALTFGLAAFTLGTDTGGSVRAPAALNGLVGLKPTFGRISTTGVIPFCWSLDHVGIMTRTVSDCADVLGAIAGFDPLDPSSANMPVDDYSSGLKTDITGLRVGVPTRFFFERVDPEILLAVEQVKQHLVVLGAKVVPVDIPDMTHTRAVSLTVQMPEALSWHTPYLRDRGDLYGQDFRAGLALGQCILAEQYVRAKRFMEQYRQATNTIFEDVDVILTPGAPEIAPKIGVAELHRDGVHEAAGNAITRFTSFFNMTGHPALTMPSGIHSEGLPMSIQLIGRYFDEKTVIQTAHAIERNEAFNVQPADV